MQSSVISKCSFKIWSKPGNLFRFRFLAAWRISFSLIGMFISWFSLIVSFDKSGSFSEFEAGLLMFLKCWKKSSTGMADPSLFLSLFIIRQYSFGSFDFTRRSFSIVVFLCLRIFF